MDIFSKNKFLAWVIIILIVLNVLSLGALWFQKNREPRPMHEYPGRLPDNKKGPGDFLAKELGLSEEQVKQFDTLREQHRTTVDGLLKEMQDAREELFAQVKSDNPDMSKVEQLESTIGQKTTELEKATFEHFKQLRAICTDEQKTKFDEIIIDAMKQAGPKGPMNQDGPPDGMRQGPPGRQGPPNGMGPGGKGPGGNRPPGGGPPPGR
ncbi:MAG: Spy/CpxP family protein refolding chaperone [Ignavibacteriae bacterium]|nr:Spy/CpxP family protein refolding chaperone [Ignavibacteriota bacterium]MCB9244557.1 Spy/CpxP family protein refolding chaperone [Ignavibacteriales bacterium]